jgi:crotonobetainyl-CoA:carnitine CoA-transferase CaiB-like acyl-CoA transferase
MKPLGGLRIIAISQYGAGPYAHLHLADLGAEIIKIEDRNSGGDVSRSVIPYAENGDSLYFQAFNRNTKSITLDLKSAQGKVLFRRLAAKSDAVFNNLRGDVPRKLGLTYEQLKEVNPKIVCCSLSGYGTSGSMQKEPAYDYLLQAVLGHMSLTGEPDGPPGKYGLSLIDFSTGIMAALGLMAGIFQAQKRGVGCDVDACLFDTTASLLNYVAIWNLNKGYTPRKTHHSAHPSLVPSQLFPTQDGHIVIMCNKEKFFPILCEAIGAAHLASDERYLNFTLRLENKETLIATLDKIFITRTNDHWLKVLSGKVPIAPVNSVKEAMQHRLMAEREMIVTTQHPTMGELKMMGVPIKVSGHVPEYHPAPALGENNREIFGELLGLSETELTELESQKII